MMCHMTGTCSNILIDGFQYPSSGTTMKVDSPGSLLLLSNLVSPSIQDHSLFKFYLPAPHWVPV